MKTIKELKAKKQIKATRRDNAFKSDAEKIAAFEEELKAAGLHVDAITEEKEERIYHCSGKVEEEHRWFCAPGRYTDPEDIKKKARRYVKRLDLQIVREYMDGDFFCIVTDRKRINKYLRFNRPEMRQAEISGVLVIRSKDYVFFFTDEKGIRHELYGAPIKKDMLTAGGLHYENERGVNLDYVFQE